MNTLALLNKLRRGVKTVNVKCTVTTPAGDSQSTTANIGVNKINKLSGNGLTAQALYNLAKLGRCEATDQFGNNFVYELVKQPSKDGGPDLALNASTEQLTPTVDDLKTNGGSLDIADLQTAEEAE